MPIVPKFIGRTHKENESITDCQDYVQPPDHVQPDEANTCFAIADGASQSFYPSIWAKLLVENFCKKPDLNEGNWKEWLIPIQKEWSSKVEDLVKEAKSESKPTWVTNQNRLNSRVPATSTFIGLQFLENQVKVSIVGDSCLFIVKDHELKETHPLKKSSDFNDRPEYFASSENHNEYSPKFIPLNYEKSPESLYFILATDALSEYIFKCVEHEEAIFKDLLSISSQKKFENFVSQARNSSSIKMKNDDVALMILEVSDGNTPEPPLQPRGTTKENFKSSISERDKTVDRHKKKNPNEQTDDSSRERPTKKKSKNQIKQIKDLKLCCTGLGALATVCLLFIFVHKPDNSGNSDQTGNENRIETTEPAKTFETITLTKGTNVYTKDTNDTKQTLINSLSSPFEALVIEKYKNEIQFESTLYARKSSLSKEKSCTENQIEIKPNEDVKISPGDEISSEKSSFGKLTKLTKFDTFVIQSLPNWCKFKFVGYIKK